MIPGRKLALARRYHAPALTQQGLADILGVERSTVAKWETRTDVPEHALRRAAERLGIKLTWFYDNQDSFPDFEPQTSNGRASTRTGEPLIRGEQSLLPVWRGVIDEEGECAFWPSEVEEFRSVPGLFIQGEPEGHALFIASGLGAAPRIDHAARVIVRRDPDPPIGSIVVTRRSDGAHFFKVLRKHPSQRLELHSLNPTNPSVRDLKGWTLQGYVVAILHPYSGHGPNIEFDDGRALRA